MRKLFWPMKSTTLPPHLGSARLLGALMLAMFLLMFVPLIMMGMATGWPGNLSEPAEVNFGFLLSVRHVMQFGYFVYLLYSLLFYPVVYLLAQHTLGLRPAVNPALPRLAVGFALASTLARGMGIMRWLTSMPVLADRYAEASPAEQQSLVYVYEATNSLMGGIGEILGVGMFAGVALLFINAFMLRHALWPRAISLLGLVSAFFLLGTTLEVFGIDLGHYLTVSVTIFEFWLLFGGIHLLRAKAPVA